MAKETSLIQAKDETMRIRNSIYKSYRFTIIKIRHLYVFTTVQIPVETFVWYVYQIWLICWEKVRLSFWGKNYSKRWKLGGYHVFRKLLRYYCHLLYDIQCNKSVCIWFVILKYHDHLHSDRFISISWFNDVASMTAHHGPPDCMTFLNTTRATSSSSVMSL